MGKLINLTGQRFGRLLVIERHGSHSGRASWLCQCDCGRSHVTTGKNLLVRYTRSCGCLHKESVKNINLSHMKSKHKLYYIWNDMKARCYRRNNPSFKNYGGRGITICDEWRDDFVKFFNWAISDGWVGGMEVHRIDNNKRYKDEIKK